MRFISKPLRPVFRKNNSHGEKNNKYMQYQKVIQTLQKRVKAVKIMS